MKFLLSVLLVLAALPAPAELRGTGDLGVVVERASGQLLVVEHSTIRASRKSTDSATCRTPRWCSPATSATPTCSGATAA